MRREMGAKAAEYRRRGSAMENTVQNAKAYSRQYLIY